MEHYPQKLFTISDVWITSYFEYRGIIPQLENQHGRIVIKFPASDTPYQLLNSFYSGDPVTLSNYIHVYKALKVRMFNARGEAR